MKSLSIFLLLVSYHVSATSVDQWQIAQRGVQALVRITFAHLGDRLVVNQVNHYSQKNKYYFTLAIGTLRRPEYVRSCFIVTMKNEGIDFISQIEQLWDQDCPPIQE